MEQLSLLHNLPATTGLALSGGNSSTVVGKIPSTGKVPGFCRIGLDDEIATFFAKGNQVPYLGSDEFRDWAYRQRQTDEMVVSKDVLKRFRTSLPEIAALIAKCFGVGVDTLTRNQRGRVDENIPR